MPTPTTHSLYATITRKGQTTVPKAVREALGVAYGARIRFDVGPDGCVTLQAVKGSLESLAGSLATGKRAPDRARREAAVTRHLENEDRKSRRM